jgi:hypothetical protein
MMTKKQLYFLTTMKYNKILIKKLTLSLVVLLFIIIISAIFVIIPAFNLDKILSVSSQIFPFTLIKQLSIFILLLSLPLFLKKSRLKIGILSFLAGCYYTAIYFFIAFWYFTHNLFNPYFLTDSYGAIIPTGVLLFGKFLTLMLFISLIILFLFIFYLFVTLYNVLYQYAEIYQQKFLKFKYLLVIPLFMLPIIPPNQGYFTFNYHLINEAQKARKFFQPIIPDYKPDLKNTSDNIFILQLESLNALVLQGQAEIKDKKYPDLYIPYLRQIAKDGVLFPYFWSNSMQTDRAQENILCSIANNIGQGFSYGPAGNLQSCLPHKLNASGYKTIAFRSDNLEFNNMGNFMNNMGFDEIHYQDIMRPEDTKYKWGYDDCTFYQRAFEYLKKQYPDPTKLLVYFEVSSTHIPWENKAPYAFADKISQPTTYAEQYINAESEQDYCLSKFYEEFKNFNPPQTHLIILSDTSCPLGINDNDIFNFQNNYNENFITTSLYIPPLAQKNKFQIGKTVTNSLSYSHNDILPTIYELLTGSNFQNSFAYELLKNPTKKDHEDCQIISQPYSGSYIIVINKDDKYIYSIIDKTVTHSNIKTDLWEKNSTIIEGDVSFQDFKDKYFCQRYK